MRDEAIRDENVKRGRDLCTRCGGTGNQLLGMWQRCEECGGSGVKDYELRKPRFKLSPELVDGDSWTPVDTKEQVLQAISSWCDDMGGFVGESFVVEVIEMSEHDIDDLPEL
jgi:hypothetical protein